MSRGWEKSDAGNYSTIVSPDGSVAIVVSTGDDATGISGRTPRTNHPKGTATIAATAANREQLELFESGVTPLRAPSAANGPMTWVFLITHDRDHGARAELSLPLTIGIDGRIESWSERIILPRLDDDGGGAARRDAEPGPEFDVDVARRAG
jgi:hypothetical protein